MSGNTKTLGLDEETRQRFCGRRRQDVENCQRALAAGELATIQTVGHRLRGSAESYGYPELGAIGEKIETAAMAGDRAALTAPLAELAAWVEANVK